MNMSIHEKRPRKYLTTSYGLFYKNIQNCRLFSTSLLISLLLLRELVSSCGQEERRLKNDTAIQKLSDIQGQARSGPISY